MYVQVYGPNANSDRFGNFDSWSIESPTDVRTTDDEVLVITTRANPTAERRALRTSRTIAYPRGEWTKVIVGEYPDRHPKATGGRI